MENFYTNDDVFGLEDYEIYYTRFSDSIITDHFEDAVEELKQILQEFSLSDSLLLSLGGGLSQITQNLRDLLYKHSWNKINIESEHRIRDRVLVSESHEIDHYKQFPKGSIGLEIEWNNKDPFFDRDLANFRKLHNLGEISMGIIITRGETLQSELLNVYKRYLNIISPISVEKLSDEFSLSQKAVMHLQKFLDLEEGEKIERIAKSLCSSKYGTATTHMSKLLSRIDRGVGDPCPLILIGIGSKRIKP